MRRVIYIGETIRRFGSRVKEHKDACVRCEIDKSALAEHARNEGHPVALDKSTLLDKVLVIKEALHISSNKGTLYNEQGYWFGVAWLLAATLSHHHSTRMLNS